MIKSLLFATSAFFTSVPDNSNPLESMVYVYQPESSSPVAFDPNLLATSDNIVPFGLFQNLPLITESEGVYAATVFDYKSMVVDCVGCEASYRWTIDTMDPFAGGQLKEEDLSLQVTNGRLVGKHVSITGIATITMIASVNGQCIRDKEDKCQSKLNCSFAYSFTFTPSYPTKDYKIHMQDVLAWPRYVTAEMHDGTGVYSDVFFHTPGCGTLDENGRPFVKFVIYDKSMQPIAMFPVVEYCLFLRCSRCRNDFESEYSR